MQILFRLPGNTEDPHNLDGAFPGLYGLVVPLQ